MRVDVIMPQMGESIAEGTLTRWLKKPGDKVAMSGLEIVTLSSNAVGIVT